jgi:hypothetical protein
MELVEAASGDLRHRRPGELRENERNPAAIVITYRDGTKATALVIGRHVRDSWGYAARLGDGRVVHSEFELGASGTGSRHFSYLGLNIQQMFLTGRPPRPIERTLLTSGILDAAMRSLHAGGVELPTDHLGIHYQPLAIEPIRPTAVK